MHHRRIAAFLAGLWIAGSLIMAYVATQNASGVDRIMHAPSAEASKIIQKLGQEQARMFLRYQAYEMTRFYMPRWEIAQMTLAALIAAVLYLGTHVNRLMVVLCGVILLVVLFMHFVLTPEITFLGRGLDFTNDRGTRYWALNALYAGLEVLKVVLVLIIAGYLFVFKTKTRTRVSKEAPGPLELADG